ncbi:MAG: phosphoglycerate dehydrogenase [Planctomycetota bacterium]|nr:MAG: phosphoglycerate dehydrogenase [Planctomycetota bacterium]
MYRVLITGAIHKTGVERLSEEPDLEVNFQPDLPIAEILKIIAPYHCIITRSETPIQKELIDCAPELKVIARAGVGIANIDVDYATRKGILVMNTPGKNTNSAAELAMGLLLAVVRKITSAHQTMQQKGWDRHRYAGVELMGKTIGIIGLGNVGHRMARFCRGFEMRVLAYDPYIPDEVFERHNVEKSDWDTLIRESDIISVHVPKNEETTGMINVDAITEMKQGVILINAARGGIVDEAALLAALKSGQVAGAGIDTWDTEPPPDNPFSDIPQVVMTPHIGASTPEAQIRIAEAIAVQVPRALRGGIVDCPVNMPQIRVLEGDLMTSYTVLAEKLGAFAFQLMNITLTHLEILYRGYIAKHDCTLLRLAFLKGYLKDMLDYVSYVNAEQRAQSIGLHINSLDDPGFTDYESAVEYVFSDKDHNFRIGGVVFKGPHPRISLVDDFEYEIEPEGTFLAIRSKDRLGVVGAIASTLDRNNILINSFEFSHHQQRKRSMFLIRVVKDVSDEVIEELESQEHIIFARKIRI